MIYLLFMFHVGGLESQQPILPIPYGNVVLCESSGKTFVEMARQKNRRVVYYCAVKTL